MKKSEMGFKLFLLNPKWNTNIHAKFKIKPKLSGI